MAHSDVAVVLVARPFRRATASAALCLTVCTVVTSGCGLSAEGEALAVPVCGETATVLATADRLGHLALAGLFARYTVADEPSQSVLVDYRGVDESPEATYLIAQALGTYASVDPSRLDSHQQRLAYWINAYNLAVVAGVLANYGGDPGFRVSHLPFFEDLLFNFGGVDLSLDQVESGVIRGDFDCSCMGRLSFEALEQMRRWHQELWESAEFDSRFHAALNCAALGCANLLADAPHVYSAELLDRQLDLAAADWLENPLKGAGPDGISAVFDWYEEDFVRSHGSVEAFIEAFRGDGLRGVDTERILDYDWTLNILVEE